MTPKKQRVEEYNAKIQKILNNSSFADPNCNSWYKNDAGLITNNWSGTVIEYQENLSKVDWDDFELRGSGKEVLQGKKQTKVGRVHEETMVSDRTLAVMSVLSVTLVAAGWLARNSSQTYQSPPRMWDDEDNNPYGSFGRRDSESSDVPGNALFCGGRMAPNQSLNLNVSCSASSGRLTTVVRLPS
ncbi:hypothetical protein LTR28_000598, partial [Elasticomyces elasticus]